MDSQSLRDQRKILAETEYNSYDPDNFPGSAGWRKNKKAADDLAIFDRNHPEILEQIRIEKKAANKAKYDSLSDFAKAGG